MQSPPIVAPEDWEAARLRLLVKEKALTKARDAMAAERRRMPWTEVTKVYDFEGPTGNASLLDLFEDRRQLIVYRAFFEPGVHGWPDHACVGCSMVADHIGNLAHLNARNTLVTLLRHGVVVEDVVEIEVHVRPCSARLEDLGDAEVELVDPIQAQ